MQAKVKSKSKQFWSVKYNLQDNTPTSFKALEINQLDLNRFIAEEGFVKYQLESNYFFCRIMDNIVTQVSEVEIREHVFSHVRDLEILIDEMNMCHRDQLENKLLKGIGTYFNKEKLLYIPTIKLDQFNRDTFYTKFLYYRNCFVEITAGGTRVKEYKDLKYFIWNSEIIDRDFEIEKIETNSDVHRFFEFISGKRGIFDNEFIPIPERLEGLKKITGYLLHNYYDYKLKSILLTDSTISENNEANGRTGKTLYCRMVAHSLSTNPADPTVKTFVEVNGKDFDPANDKKYQTLSIETKLLHINDVKKYFDADSLYNDITDGLTVNRKFRDPFKINVKMIISTNKTIKLDGESSKDRFIEFQFSDYFNSKNTPESVFKRWFFRDWNDKHWRQYDNFIHSCVYEFMKEPVVTQPPNINLSHRKILEQTNSDFVEFMETKVEIGKWYSTDELFRDFNTDYPEHASDKRHTIIRFKKWLISWCNLRPELMNYNKKTHEERRESIRGIIFRPIE